jgi:hypothetical protein
MPDIPKQARVFKPKTTDERGYDSDWKRLRIFKLATHPACQAMIKCHGMVATEVHHKKPIAQFPHLRLVFENLLSVCDPCHQAIEKGEVPGV